MGGEVSAIVALGVAIFGGVAYIVSINTSDIKKNTKKNTKAIAEIKTTLGEMKTTLGEMNKNMEESRRQTLLGMAFSVLLLGGLTFMTRNMA